MTLLSTLVHVQLVDNPTIPDSLKSQVNLDQINFVSNDQLEDVLSQTTATPEQVDEAVAINTEARLRALRTSLLVLAGMALLAVIPAGRMPGAVPEEAPVAGDGAAGQGRAPGQATAPAPRTAPTEPSRPRATRPGSPGP